MIREGTAKEIITSRLLVLQSKRLMLNAVQRRLRQTGRESLQRRAEQLSADCENAQHKYRMTVLTLGSPEHAYYWIVAYSKLIEKGNALTVKLRDAVVELPVSERYQVSADVEMLESIVDDWTDSLRTAMAGTVA